MFEVAAWYLATLAVGAGALLPATVLFTRLRSRGVLYARPLGLLLVAQATWLTAALTSVAYGLTLIAGALAALFAWSAWIAWRDPARLRLLFDRRYTLLAGEVLFIAAFALIAFVRAQAPAAIATEKPMDLMLLTVVHNAETMPPPDAWLAGFDVSYYHLGHVMVDVVQQLTGIAPAQGFNLGLAATGAMVAVATAGVAVDAVGLGWVRRRSTVWVAAALAIIGMVWLAPFEGLAELAAANGLGGVGFWGTLGVAGLPGPAEATNGVPDAFWWWWRATRVVPGTISEFPAFSLILGDLHAHVLALPLGLTAVALALETFEGGTALTWKRWTGASGALLLAGALFAGLAMTNAWDVVTYGLLWLAAATWVFASVGWPIAGALFGAARYLALPAAVGGAIAWPMVATFEGERPGLTLVTDGASDPARFLLFWGAVLLPVAVAAVCTRMRVTRRHVAIALLLSAAPAAVWTMAAFVGDDGAALADRGAGWVTLGALVLVMAAAVAAAWGAYRDGARDRAAWLALAAAAGAIVLATELFHVVDALGFGRLNSVFKFWGAAWPLLALAGAVGVALAWDRSSLPRIGMGSLRLRAAVAGALIGAATLLWLGSLLYAPAAAVSRAREAQEPGLDALAYLDVRDPGAAEALRWVRANLDAERHVLLEAVGASYGSGNVISAASGVPTLLGWPGHQVQWRATPPVAGRQATVDDIYREGATPRIHRVALRDGVTHVYLGNEERRQYGADVATRFEGWPVVFELFGTRIVAVPPGGAP
ncbi:MAG: hypothetical protein F4Z08_07100 [Chloroflexi bacterium]|nr:hypothetical protein [Chloroflexota bacterium]